MPRTLTERRTEHIVEQMEFLAMEYEALKRRSLTLANLYDREADRLRRKAEEVRL